MLVMVTQVAMAVVIEAMVMVPVLAPLVSLLPSLLRLVEEVTVTGELEPKTCLPRPRRFVVSASAETTMWTRAWARWEAFQVV